MRKTETVRKRNNENERDKDPASSIETIQRERDGNLMRETETVRTRETV